MASYSKAEVEVRRGPPGHHRQQVCLLCLGELNHHRGNSSNSNETALYLKNLLCFLKVDVSKIPLGSSSSSHLPGLRGNHCWTEEEVVRCSAICSECDFLVDAFGEKYKVFEPAWKKMLTCIQMLKTKTNSNPSTTPQTGDDGGESGLSKYYNLRAVLLAKYNLVLKSDVDEELPPNCVGEPQAVSNAQEYIIYDVEGEGEENGSANGFWDDDVESEAADQMEDSNSEFDQAGQVGGEEEEDVRGYEELRSGVEEEEDDGRGEDDKEEEKVPRDLNDIQNESGGSLTNLVTNGNEPVTSPPSASTTTPYALKSRSCDYCPKTFRMGPKSSVEKHLVCVHTVKYFPEHFAGFSQEELDAVTEDMISQDGPLLTTHNVDEQQRTTTFQCSFCHESVVKESDKKFHLLKRHVEEVSKTCLERRRRRGMNHNILDERETGQVGFTVRNALAVEKGDAQIKLEPRTGRQLKTEDEVDDEEEEEIDDSRTEDLNDVRDRNVEDLQQELDKNEPEVGSPPPPPPEEGNETSSYNCSYCTMSLCGSLEDLEVHQMVSHTVRYYADQGNALIGRSTDEEVDKIVEDLISQYLLFFSAPPGNQEDTSFRCSLCPESVLVAGNKRIHFLRRHLDAVQSMLEQSRRRRVPIQNRIVEPSSSSSSSASAPQLRLVKQEPPEEPLNVTSAGSSLLFPQEGGGVSGPTPSSTTTTELEQMRSQRQVDEQADLEDLIFPSPSISFSRNDEQFIGRTPSTKRGSSGPARPVLENQCLYCKKPFRGPKANLEQHVMRFHALQHLSQQLRPGTSKEVLKSAIDRICNQSIKSRGNWRERRFDCSLCSRSRTGDKRCHIFKEHLPELLSRVELEGNNNNVASSGGVPTGNFDESLAPSGRPRHKPDSSGEVPLLIPPSRGDMVVEQMRQAATRVGDFNLHLRSSRNEQLVVATSSKTTGNTRRRRRRPNAGNLKCSYCDFHGPRICRMERHAICVHTVQHFSHHIPPATTQEALNKALENTYRQIFSGGGGRRGFHCSLCGVAKRDDKKYHVLKQHLPEFLSRLQEESSSVVPSSSSNYADTLALLPTSSLQIDIKQETAEQVMDHESKPPVVASSSSSAELPQVSSEMSEINHQNVIQSFFIAKRDYFKSTDIRPPFTYAFIVGQAILESGHNDSDSDDDPKQLSTTDIVSWAQTNFLHCQHLARLQRNVREALAENKNCFVRVRPLGHQDDLWGVREEEFFKTKWLKDTPAAKRMVEEYEASIWASSSSSADGIMQIHRPSTSTRHMEQRQSARRKFQAHREAWRTRSGRPPFTYIFLIQQAIKESPKTELNIPEIYAWLQLNFGYFQKHRNMTRWKRTVRDTLNYSKCFARVGGNDAGIWGAWRVRTRELYNPRTEWLYVRSKRKYTMSTTRKRKR